MSVENQSRIIFGQTYVYKNPDENSGPGVWRLCVPGEESCGSGGGNVSPLGVFVGIAPMTVNSTITKITIGFDMSNLPGVNDLRSMSAVVRDYKSVGETLVEAIKLGIFGSTFVVPSASDIKANLPIKMTEVAETTYVSADFRPVGDVRNVSSTKSYRVLDNLESSYNIGSAAAKVEVAADEPVVVTVAGDTATFELDYRSLPDA